MTWMLNQVELGCEDPKYSIKGNKTIRCLLNKTWSPLLFPSCSKKTCDPGKYLTAYGSCADSTCSKGKMIHIINFIYCKRYA